MGSTRVSEVSLTSFIKAGAGTLISQCITFACLPILFRLYAPEHFAPWALALAVASFAGGVATLRYELAVVVERDHLDASALFWLSMALAVVLGGIAAAALSAPALQVRLFGSVRETGLGGALTTWLMLVALTQVVSGWSLHCGAFSAVSLGQVGNAIATNAVQLAGGFIAPDGRWLILGSILGQATLLVLTGWLTLRRSRAPAWPGTCVARIKRLAARHWRFPVFSTPYTFCSIARDRGPILVLGSFASGTDVGLYSQAWRILNAPVGISSSAVRPVVFHAAAKHGLAAQEAHVGRILAAFVVLGAPWLAIFAFHAGDIFALVLGESWRGAGPLAALMIVPVFLLALSNWFDRFFDLTGRQEVNLVVEFATAAASTGALAVAFAAGAGVPTAVAIQCAVLAVSEAVLIVLAYRVAGFRLRILGRLVLMGVAIAAAFAIGLRMTDAWMASASIVLAASIVAITVGGFAAWPLLRGMR